MVHEHSIVDEASAHLETHDSGFFSAAEAISFLRKVLLYSIVGLVHMLRSGDKNAGNALGKIRFSNIWLKTVQLNNLKIHVYFQERPRQAASSWVAAGTLQWL